MSASGTGSYSINDKSATSSGAKTRSKIVEIYYFHYYKIKILNYYIISRCLDKFLCEGNSCKFTSPSLQNNYRLLSLTIMVVTFAFRE